MKQAELLARIVALEGRIRALESPQIVNHVTVTVAPESRQTLAQLGAAISHRLALADRRNN